MTKYQLAIAWIASNDDTEWLQDEEVIPSVTAALVADIFERTIKQVTLDLRKELRGMN